MKKILLVDDHDVVRDGVKKAFGEQLNEISFGDASSGSEALRLAAEETWDLVVLDLSLGSRSGLEVLKELKQMCPKLPVLILSMHSDEQYARRAFKAGAAGYITKESPRSELAKAIKKTIEGGRYISPIIADKFIIDLGSGRERAPHETLSDREFEVMCLIASGKTVGEIAGLLFLSDKTISTYRSRILEKMDLKNNAELTHYAARNKLIDSFA